MDFNIQTELPRLLQLCAERVASMVNRRKKTHRYLNFLKYLNLPKIDITYLDYNDADYYDALIYATCDFSKYIRRKHWEPIIVPSVPKWSQNYRFKVRIGAEKVLYISTLADLGSDMLKLDFPTGEYELFTFEKGYVLRMNDYSPRIQDVIHIFNTRDGDKGLSGTYHCGEIKDVNLLRLFNEYISEYISKKWWTNISEYPYRAKVDSIGAYNNIPVLFYLTKNINVDELNKVTLRYPSEINDCGNIIVCWYVHLSENERIGVAVQQNEFYNMMGDQAGVCLLSSKGYRAIGNYNLHRTFTGGHMDDRVYDSRHYYECEFNPCCCDFSCYSIIERQYYGGLLSPNTCRRVRDMIYAKRRIIV